MTKAKSQKKMGRPRTYTPELGLKICKAIATSPDGIKKICARNPDFPTRETIWEWRFEFDEFSNMYDKAKRMQADVCVEEIIDIADDDSQDTMINEKGNEVCNSEYIARSRLRVDTRKWVASKLIPKVYGDKIQNETTVTIKHEDAIKELE